jgi:hypothetical protein
MRVTKIIEKAPFINGDNEWIVWVQVQIGKSYQYGRVVCKTIDEAMSIREGMILDTEKHEFLKNTKPLIKL